MEELYKHILVPLDGSELAEVALDHAFTLAKLTLAEVTLLRVLRPIPDVIKLDEHHAIYVDEQWTINLRRANKYLERVRDRVKDESFLVETAVETGRSAETIITYASDHAIDLIVMATHGRGGFERLVYGSVADKVLRGADHPVLLVRSYPRQEATA